MSLVEARIAASGGSIHEHRKATRRMRWWYESLADFMIANPKATQEDMAAHFQKARGTISTIVNSDAFTAYMRQRRNAHEAALDSSVRAKMFNMLDLSLDVMKDKIDRKRDSLPIREIKDVTDMALKALGYTADKPSGPSPVTINNHPGAPTYIPVPVDMATLSAAREALVASQNRNTLAPPMKVIDVTPESAKPVQSGSVLDDLV